MKSFGHTLHQASLLAAVFLAPIIWGRFDAFSASIILSLLCLSAIGLLITRPARLFPSGLPLTSFHFALTAFLAVSLISYFFSLSKYASALELLRLFSGALAFWLTLHTRVQSVEPGVESKSKKKKSQETKSKSINSQISNLKSQISPFRALLFFLLVVLGLLTYDWSFYFAFEQILALFAFILIALILLTARLWKNPLKTGVLSVALASASIVAAYGIYDWLFMRFVAKNTTWHTFSTFYNPNPFAGFLGLALFLAVAITLGVFLAQKKSSPKIWLSALCLLLLAPLPFTDSKAAWLSIYLAGIIFLLIVIIVLIASFSKKILLICLLLFLTLASPAALIAARPSLHRLAVKNLGLQNNSNMLRYLTWKGTLHMAEAHPWTGVGAGAFEYAFGRYAIAGYTRRAHQNYLEVASETGFPGLGIFLWLIGAGLVGLGRAIKKAPSPSAKLLSSGALAAMLVMVFHSFFDYDWYIGANMLFFFVAIAIGLTPSITLQEIPAKSSRPLWPILIGAILLILIAAKSLTLGRAEIEVSAAQLLIAQERPYEARDELQSAASLAPTYAKAKWMLGSLSSPQEGLPLLQKAIALEPEYHTYRAALGRMRKLTGDLNGALEAYSKAVEVNPQYLGGWLELAQLNLSLGRPEQALENYRQVIQIQEGPVGRYPAIDYEVKTEYAEAHYGLGLATSKGFAAGGPEAAIKEFQQGLKILDQYARVGHVFEEQRSSIGEGEIGKKPQLDLLRAKCNFRLSEALQSLGRQTEADKYLAAANKLRPDISVIIAAENLPWKK